MCSTDQMAIFKEVADTGNITQASKRLHISQPSVSVQIKNLETMFGTSLFKRTNRGVTLTRAGQILYEQVIIALDAIDTAKQNIDDLLHAQQSCIRIGATTTIGEYLLPYLMSIPNGENPAPHFNATIATGESILQDVREGHLDIGLIEGELQDDEDITIEKFWTDQMGVIVPVNHRWGANTEISFEELTEERFVTREKGSSTRSTYEKAFAEKGYDPKELHISMELNSTEAIMKAVTEGYGVTINSILAIQEKCRQAQVSMLHVTDCPLTRPFNIVISNKVDVPPEKELILKQIHSLTQIYAPTQQEVLVCFLPARDKLKARKEIS